MKISRRRCLRAGVTGSLALAGCLTQAGGGGEDTPTSTPQPSTTERSLPTMIDRCETDPRIDGAHPQLLDFDSRAALRCAGEPIDRFEDLHWWEARAGSLSADEDTTFVGPQSARVEATTEDERAWIYRTFVDGIDLSNHDLSLALYLDAPTSGGITVNLEAPDYENTLYLGRGMWSAGWTRVDLGPERVRGSPDLTNVTEIGIQMYTGGDTAARFFVDELRVHPKADAGRVLFTFDDNFRRQYEVAFPLMQEYGFPGVVGVIPGTVGASPKIPLSGMEEMRDAGWEMASHPQVDDTFREMTEREIRDRIRTSKEWLVDNGFERGAQHVIWPYNAYGAASLGIASRYHKLGFALSGSPSGRISDPMVVGRVDGTDVESTNRAFELAEEYNETLILMYHDVGEGTKLSRDAFVDTLDAVERSDLEVTTATGLWESARSAAGVET